MSEMLLDCPYELYEQVGDRDGDSERQREPRIVSVREHLGCQLGKIAFVFVNVEVPELAELEKLAEGCGDTHAIAGEAVRHGASGYIRHDVAEPIDESAEYLRGEVLAEKLEGVGLDENEPSVYGECCSGGELVQHREEQAYGGRRMSKRLEMMVACVHGEQAAHIGAIALVVIDLEVLL